MGFADAIHSLDCAATARGIAVAGIEWTTHDLQRMKRIEFLISDENGEILREPAFVEDCFQIPHAVMRAVEDFLEAHDGQLHLPIVIRVRPAVGVASC